ncbi:MAG: aminomethyl-transferring glycine dehydrogenase subunit GcvPB [Candidatus Heimdallarchaeota archaeon]|nr:aminomethyl-transferring glycine dehydrogenase subunit GcvPB [Candidatus Heimdallarchaeota archaeon]
MKKRVQAQWNEDLIMKKGYKGRRAHIPAQVDVPKVSVPENWQRKKPANLPEVSELELVRHVVRLSQMNHGVDVGEYPLGSCTMKYNPKVNERIVRFGQFAEIHPDTPEELMQGSIEVIYRLQEAIKGMTGFEGVTVQPTAGAQGEFLGMLIAQAYHADNGDTKRNTVLVPDSAHGTNPASAAMAGYKVIELPSTPEGFVDLEMLEAALDDTIAAFMITNPNTLGLFEPQILKISEMVHNAGALMYLDGANFNGIVGVVKPTDMGFDIMHLNMHKTFSGPHGGGGPGCGPVGVVGHLAKYLPKPLAQYDADKDYYYLDYDMPSSIGKLHGYFGNFGIILRTLAYIYRNGGEGVREFCYSAVLNANYLMEKVKEIKGFSVPKSKDMPRKHEFIASPVKMMQDTGVTAGDIAKAMLDYGIHAPTIYFPLIVHEAMMFEPTEAETRTSLDNMAEALQEISDLAYSNPDEVHKMPRLTGRGRLDELSLAKNPVLSKKSDD